MGSLFNPHLDLIDRQFGASNADRNSPADAERCREDEPRLLLAELLTEGTARRVDKRVSHPTLCGPERPRSEEVSRRSSRSWGSPPGLRPTRSPGVSRAVLPAHESNRKNREAAIEWAMEHPSKVEEDPSAWRVYDRILRYSKENAYRIMSIQHLGAHVPTSTLRPLPTDVAEVWKLLNSLADQDEDSDLQQEAKAAIAQIIQRGRDEAARETRINICEIDPESSAALSCEWIPRFVEPPRLLISINLTIFPRSGRNFLCATHRCCITGGFSRSHRGSASRSRPFVTPVHDERRGRWLLPARFSTTPAAVHVDRVDLATVSFTTTDPAVQHTRMLISRPGGNIGLAKAEQERFRDRYQALGPLVESGEINAAVLKGPMAALNKAYRELNGAESERVLGVSEAAEVLGLTRSRVQQLAREGLGQKVAGRFLFSREELGHEKQRPRSKGGRPPTADRLDLAAVSFTTSDPSVQHTRMLVSGPGGNMGLAKAEQERFKDRYQALGPLVESGEINAAVLKGPIAALNEAYRELNVEGGASGGGEFPPPRDLERKPGWADRSFEREALPTTSTGSERVLGVSEAVEVLGLTRSRVQQLAREGLGQKVAGRFLFSREELEQEKQRPRSKGGRPPIPRNEDRGKAEPSLKTHSPNVE